MLQVGLLHVPSVFCIGSEHFSDMFHVKPFSQETTFIYNTTNVWTAKVSGKLHNIDTKLADYTL